MDLWIVPRGALKTRCSGLDSWIIPAWSLKIEVFRIGLVDRPSILFQIGPAQSLQNGEVFQIGPKYFV